MTNDITNNNQLESPLFGSLIHATEVSSSILKSHIAIGCIVDHKNNAQSHYISANHFNTSQDKINNLIPITQHIRSLKLNSSTITITDIASHPNHTPFILQQPLNDSTTISDLICLNLDVNINTNILIVYLRCNDATPFTEQAISLLEQLKPNIARMLTFGAQRELLGHDSDLPHAPNTPSPLNQINKLSKTERIVFDHLRKEMTEKEIAQVMSRSKHTIHVYVKNIYNKLNISSRRELLELYDQLKNLINK
ncbi:Bacterial regulatory protein, luxR family [Poriferisphaera corsica]|uniref:Bacterial regulatory protein, luxR family n=1 Tax=Poriferisphaera corsica TaxID=2528020 RepID=A0A517YST9_9BACT|nr:helix-turn-helix transcriptional regulator [Poriferisphaera corsica]QDU33300.1 Bacterial regulatory protein, luxR family [Poriferisphaera corsica]